MSAPARTFSENGAKTRQASVSGIDVHISAVQRRTGGSQRRRGRSEEWKRLPERDDLMPCGAQRRGAGIQWVERGELNVADARRDAREHAPIVMDQLPFP